MRGIEARSLAVVVLAVLMVGCEHRADMRTRLGALPVPAYLRFVSEAEGGANPPLFGNARPYLSRTYMTDHDMRTVCADIKGVLDHHASPESYNELADGCSGQARTSSGWGPRVAGTWSYRVGYRVYAEDSGSRVVIGIVDR